MCAKMASSYLLPPSLSYRLVFICHVVPTSYHLFLTSSAERHSSEPNFNCLMPLAEWVLLADLKLARTCVRGSTAEKSLTNSRCHDARLRSLFGQRQLRNQSVPRRGVWGLARGLHRFPCSPAFRFDSAQYQQGAGVEKGLGRPA